MSKKIVICCDGTGNSFENIGTESNVAKLYSCLTIGPEQIGYYHPGVGTMGAPSSRGFIEKNWSRLRGLAFGSGLLANVGDAYRYLMDNYADGDEIYLFGFSRGAFTARALASLLHVYGLLCSGNHELIPYILAMYSKRTREANRKQHIFNVDEAFKWQFSHANDVAIHFCGMWDTVCSYGWIYNQIRLPFVGRNPIIKTGRHAISIHERRCFYQASMWGKSFANQDIKQVWFAGVHSDVGGSYPEQESGLSKLALEWMLVEAAMAGLLIDRKKAEVILGRTMPEIRIGGLPDFAPPDEQCTPHQSLSGAWWLLECLPHRDMSNGKWRIPRGAWRQIPPQSRIHESVLNSVAKPKVLPSFEVEPWVRYPVSKAAAATDDGLESTRDHSVLSAPPL